MYNFPDKKNLEVKSMNKLKTKVLAGILGGFFLATNIFSVGEVYAAEQNKDSENAEVFVMQKRPELTDEQAKNFAEEISKFYGVNSSEVETALKEHTYFRDIRHAATLAKISGKSFAEVLSMKSDWWQVAEKLGVTLEQINRELDDEMFISIANDIGADKKIVAELWQKGYNPHDIYTAGIIAKLSGKNIKNILEKRKINNTWGDVAKEFKVSPEKLREYYR